MTGVNDLLSVVKGTVARFAKCKLRLTPDADVLVCTPYKTIRAGAVSGSFDKNGTLVGTFGVKSLSVFGHSESTNPKKFTYSYEVRTRSGKLVAKGHVYLVGGQTYDLNSWGTVPTADDGKLSGAFGSSSGLFGISPRYGRKIATVGWFGDSWSTVSTMGASGTLPYLTCQQLGCVPMVSAINGSSFGYSASGSDGFETDARINAVVAAHPDLIVTVGSLNGDRAIDNGDSDGTNTKGAVKTFISKVRDALPSVPIVIVGPQPSSVARMISRSAHINARALREGVEESGGTSNGVAFVDWLGVSEKQAVVWAPGSSYSAGDVVVYGGVAWRVVSDFVASETPYESENVVMASAVLSGTGRSNSAKNDGTRDTLLLSDETHPTQAGSAAFAAELAVRINEAVATLSSWGGTKPSEPEPPTPGPSEPEPVEKLPIMAFLSTGWGNPDREYYTLEEVRQVTALKPDRIAVPLRTTLDANDFAVAIAASTQDSTNTTRRFGDGSIGRLRERGINVASLTEVVSEGIEVVLNVRNGLADAAAQYWTSSDKKALDTFKENPLVNSAIHGRGQSALREIMVDQYPEITRIVDATDATSDAVLDAVTVRAAQQIILDVATASSAVWNAAKRRAPDGVWALVSSSTEMDTAKVMAEASGNTILGWVVTSSEAFSAVNSAR